MTHVIVSERYDASLQQDRFSCRQKIRYENQSPAMEGVKNAVEKESVMPIACLREDKRLFTDSAEGASRIRGPLGIAMTTSGWT